jgi:DNA-nicking Smr family endonuclease
MQMAGRRLSADEAALWRRVAGSVRALRPAAPLAIDPQAVRSPRAKSMDAGLKNSPLSSIGTKGTRAGQSQNTLDGTWDRKIGNGQIQPDRTIDLHGYNLSAAHHRLDRGFDEAIRDGARVILLVTGRPARSGASRIDLPLRGIIRESVGDWLASSRHQPAIAAIRNAHPRHGGAGALYIILRRTR